MSIDVFDDTYDTRPAYDVSHILALPSPAGLANLVRFHRHFSEQLNHCPRGLASSIPHPVRRKQGHSPSAYDELYDIVSLKLLDFSILYDNTVAYQRIKESSMTREELRQWRQIHEVTPAALATGLGVDRNTIYRYESGVFPIPDDIEHRLAVFLALRDTEAAKEDEKPAWTDIDDPSTEAPHGSVPGTKRYFWRQWTDAQRVGWIMDPANNPARALPFPLWSHGYRWFTSKTRKGAPIPHYLSKGAVSELMSRITTIQTDKPGTTVDAALRDACIAMMRKYAPSWQDPDAPLAGITDDQYKSLLKAINEAK